ncbi:hypothetical protein DSLASN_20040 [Desulfoluna limicola]|uniref:Uncharacterized protein n=1 Tax=Desulfoluna limicola TaxID=2810562 RepID=A0ABM7PGB3_9BACT|nr:hypothetical protein DSLASN_20040 [Desulfoluna limicola]
MRLRQQGAEPLNPRFAVARIIFPGAVRPGEVSFIGQEIRCQGPLTHRDWPPNSAGFTNK